MFEAVVGNLDIVRDDIFGDSLAFARYRVGPCGLDELLRILRRGKKHIDERSFFQAVMSSEESFAAWEKLLNFYHHDVLEALTFVDPCLGINRVAEQSFLSTEYQVIGRADKYDIYRDLKFFGAFLGGGWIDPHDRTWARAIAHKTQTEEFSVQLQVKCKDYLKCVHLVLGRIGLDLVARADWAAYTTVDHEFGYNFEKASDKHIVPVATSAGADGYGVSGLYLYYMSGGMVR